MLASDTRRTFYNARGELTRYDDGTRKTYGSDSIIVTGTGSVPLLEAVCRRITSAPLDSLDQVLEIIGEERNRFATADLPAFHLEHGLWRTGWFMSGRFHRNDASGFKMALIAYHPGLGHELRVHGPGAAVPLIPIDDDRAGPWDVVKSLLSGCRMCDVDEDPGESLAFNARLMRAIIAGCADVFPSVSPVSEISVHLIDGTTRQLPAECGERSIADGQLTVAE